MIGDELRAPGRILVLRFIFAAVILLLLWITWRHLSVDARSYVIEARTHGLEIKFFASKSKQWFLPEETMLCHRGCRVLAADERLLEWQDGTTVALRPATPAGLEILILEPEPPESDLPGSGKSVEASRPLRTTIGAEELTPGMRLILPEEGWSGAGNLTFSGFTRIGSEVSSGLRDHLVSGSYQVREILPSYWFRPSHRPAVTVLEGKFFPGDEVTFLRPKDGALVKTPLTGFVSPPPEEEDAAWLQVVGYSPTMAGIFMRINRQGTEPSDIEPNWAHRAIKDPIALGLAALLTMAAAFAQIVATIVDLVPRDRLHAEIAPPPPRKKARTARKGKGQAG